MLTDEYILVKYGRLKADKGFNKMYHFLIIWFNNLKNGSHLKNLIFNSEIDYFIKFLRLKSFKDFNSAENDKLF